MIGVASTRPQSPRPTSRPGGTRSARLGGPQRLRARPGASPGAWSLGPKPDAPSGPHRAGSRPRRGPRCGRRGPRRGWGPRGPVVPRSLGTAALGPPGSARPGRKARGRGGASRSGARGPSVRASLTCSAHRMNTTAGRVRPRQGQGPGRRSCRRGRRPTRPLAALAPRRDRTGRGLGGGGAVVFGEPTQPRRGGAKVVTGCEEGGSTGLEG